MSVSITRVPSKCVRHCAVCVIITFTVLVDHCTVESVTLVSVFHPDGAPLPESAAEHEGKTGAVGLYKSQSPELCSVS